MDGAASKVYTCLAPFDHGAGTVCYIPGISVTPFTRSFKPSLFTFCSKAHRFVSRSMSSQPPSNPPSPLHPTVSVSWRNLLAILLQIHIDAHNPPDPEHQATLRPPQPNFVVYPTVGLHELAPYLPFNLTNRTAEPSGKPQPITLFTFVPSISRPNLKRSSPDS